MRDPASMTESERRADGWRPPRLRVRIDEDDSYRVERCQYILVLIPVWKAETTERFWSEGKAIAFVRKRLSEYRLLAEIEARKEPRRIGYVVFDTDKDKLPEPPHA